MKTLIPILICIFLISCNKDNSDDCLGCDVDYVQTTYTDSITGHLYVDCNLTPAANELVKIQIEILYNGAPDYLQIDTVYTDDEGLFQYNYTATYGYLDLLLSEIFLSDTAVIFLSEPFNQDLQINYSFTDTVHLVVDLEVDNAYTALDTLWYCLCYTTANPINFITGPFSDMELLNLDFAAKELVLSPDDFWGTLSYGIGYDDFYEDAYGNSEDTQLYFNHEMCSEGDTLTIHL